MISFAFVASIATMSAVASPGKIVDRGVLTLRLIRCLAPLALGLMIFAAAAPARAIDAVSVRSDAPAKADRIGSSSHSPTTPTISSTA